jgi:hypothetical protein
VITNGLLVIFPTMFIAVDLSAPALLFIDGWLAIEFIMGNKDGSEMDMLLLTAGPECPVGCYPSVPAITLRVGVPRLAHLS